MKKLLLITVLLSQVAISQVTDTGGNVGIGTTTPTQKLEVNGNIKAIATNPNISIIGEGNGNYHGASLFLSANGVNSGNEHVSTWIMNHRGTDGIATFTLQRRNILNEYKGSLLSYSDGVGWKFNVAPDVTSSTANSAMIINSSGNVGIGTANPDMKLSVSANQELLTRFNYSGTSEMGGVRIGKVSSYADLFISSNGFGIGTGTNGGNLPLNTQNTNHIDFFINKTNGNVGIGTTTPDSKLAVNGTIHTKEVKVDLIGWPDYVFESTYNLPALEEVEQHINEKGHLQNIPSAENVKENGILLGEMDAKLLQKIEELTLYTIQQENKLKEQESKIENIENENKVLKELSAKFIELQTRLEKLETK